MVYAGHGDFFEVIDCYCEEVGDLPFAPGFPEVIDNEHDDYDSAPNVES
jgi:hypothetical protein